jgi:hypothetical protein
VRRIRHLGLAVLAAAALTALLGAGTASAAQFRAEEYPTTVTGTQTVAQKFTTWEKGPTWTCSNVTTVGTISAASTTLSLAPTFTGCAFAGQAASVKMNTCKYVYKNSSEQMVNTGTIDISCSKAGDEIEVVASICTLKIPAQAARSSVQYSGGPVQEGPGGEGYKRKIGINLNATGFTYSLSGFVCGKTGTFEGGVLTGSHQLLGKNAQHEVGIYLSNEQSANFPMFVSEEYPEVVEAALSEGVHFGFASGGISCSAMRGNGLITSVPKGQLILGLRSLPGCTFPAKRNGCSFTLAGPIGGSGSMAIECPPGKELTFGPVWSCTVTVPSQGGLGPVTYSTKGTGATREITASVNAKNLKYTASKICFNAGTYTNGTLIFSWQLKGSKFLFSEQRTEEEVQFLEHIGFGQRGLWVE